MQHRFATPMPHCLDCHRSFWELKETGEPCGGKPEIAAPGLEVCAPVTPAATQRQPPAPQVMFAQVTLFDMIRSHWNAGCEQPDENIRRRLVARSLARADHCDPDTIVIRRPQVGWPKGTLPVEHLMIDAAPLWALYWEDAGRAMKAIELAGEGKEIEQCP